VFMYWYELRTGRGLATPDGVLFSEGEPGASPDGEATAKKTTPPRSIPK